jgi:regulator of sigma E protease
MLITVFVFLAILTVLVLIHELGHFLVAKFYGIKVEEFGFGFPPRVWGKKHGETLYSINLLPIGGFVKLYGEDDAGGGRINPKSETRNSKEDIERAFFSKPKYQRILVIVAGVAMNFLLAIIIATYLFTFQGIPKIEDNVLITEVVKGSPAAVAGFQKGDLVTEINSVKIKAPKNLIEETKKKLGQEITVAVKRGDSVKILKVTPRVNAPKNEGAMGVAISENIIYQKYPFPQSLFYGTKQAFMDSKLVVLGFVDVIKTIVTRFTVPAGVAGPVGMAQLTGEFVKIGPSAVLSLVYMLTLSLAVLNILPIPGLDGGRLLFIVIEAITRKKVDPKFESYAHMVGIILLLAFLAIVSYKDILRIISGQSIFPQ